MSEQIPDVLDQIIEMLPPSTLEFLLRRGDTMSSVGKHLDSVLSETRALCVDQAARQIQRDCLNVKSKVAENSALLERLSREIERAQSAVASDDCEQSLEASRKRLADYDVQVKEIQKKLGNVDCVKLFNDIENLHREREELREKIGKLNAKYECFEGLPPSIEGAKKAIEDIKKRIRANEKEMEGYY